MPPRGARRRRAIYQIRHLATGRLYVGLTGDTAARFAVHRSGLAQRRHHRRALQADWARDGAAAFVFEVLEDVPAGTSLYAREAHYLAALQPYYNLVPNNPARPRVQRPTRPFVVHDPGGYQLPGLRQARTQQRMSQEDLHAATGVAAATISELETAKRGAYPRTVRKLAKALGVTPARLYAAPEASP